jgi:Protein of unknown function (DUF3179)
VVRSQTKSVWSQPTGRALSGPFEGTRLRQIPAAVETWGTWSAEHPNTTVLDNGRGVPELLDTDFVIGLRLHYGAAAFRYTWVVEQGVVNDEVGGIPIAVFARSDGVVRVFSRSVDGGVVSLVEDDGRLVDSSSGSVWDQVTGAPLGGPLTGPLVPLPWATFYPEAWARFYPNARLVG